MVEYYRATDWRTRAESLGHSLGVVVAAFLVGYVLLNVVALALVAADVVSVEALANEEVPVPPNVYAAVTVAQFFGMGVLGAAYLWWRGGTDLFDVAVPDLRDVATVVVGFVAIFVAATALSVVIRQLGVETATNQVVEQGQQNPAIFLYMIPITIVFVAPAEELIFRGIVQGLFRRAYGVVPAVVLASALFGVAHWLALTGGGRLTYIAIAAVLGVVLGVAYELTENLAVPVVIHGLWNAFLFGSQYAAATNAAAGMV
ncbi:MAG: CPBP family glutamic-type intramembrane protease [Haloarculaceae archaeon]